MKNTLFFSYFLLGVSLCSNLTAHDVQEQSALEEFAGSIDFNSIFETCGLDSCSLPDTQYPSTLRNARAVSKHESMAQKIQNVIIRCYAYMLCRYYAIQKWLLKSKQQKTTATT